MVLNKKQVRFLDLLLGTTCEPSLMRIHELETKIGKLETSYWASQQNTLKKDKLVVRLPPQKESRQCFVSVQEDRAIFHGWKVFIFKKRQQCDGNLFKNPHNMILYFKIHNTM